MAKEENKIGTIVALFAVLVFGVLVVVVLSLGGGEDEDLTAFEPTEAGFLERRTTSPYASLGGSNKKESTLSDVELGPDEVSEFILGHVPSVVLPEPELAYEDDFVWTFSEPYLGEVGEKEDGLQKALRESLGKKEEIPPSDWVPPTDEEVFHRLFPDHYLDGLSYYQDQLINTGYFEEEDRLTFDSLDNVIEGLDRGLTYLLDTGNITQEEYDKFRIGIYGEFRSLIMYEWEQLKNENGPYDMESIKQGAFNVKDFWPPRLLALSVQSSCVQVEKESVFKKLWRRISAFFSPETAYAGLGCVPYVIPGVAVCIEGVECYRSGPPIPAGVNLWAPCCCCCAGKVPIGCLNAVCLPPHAAIWDPMTGICGCG